MNAVARIFVVINLLLAGGFLLAAATFLHQNTKWKEELAKVEATAEANKRDLNGQITNLQTELTGSRTDLNSAKQNVTAVENDKSNLETRLVAEERGKLSAERQLTQAGGNMSTLTNNFEGLKGTLDTLKGQVDTYRQQSIDAMAAKAKAESVATEANVKADAMDAVNAKLKDNLMLASADNGKLSAMLKRYQELYPAPAAKAQPKVDGAVVRFDVGTQLVEINKGRSDGIAHGHEFDIVRGTTFIGTVRISRVEVGSSVGSVYIPSPGHQPRAGDTATKL
ncbi:MAG: hypothetical protein V3W41_19595 [Planctomycetota bacterium]